MKPSQKINLNAILKKEEEKKVQTPESQVQDTQEKTPAIEYSIETDDLIPSTQKEEIEEVPAQEPMIDISAINTEKIKQQEQQSKKPRAKISLETIKTSTKKEKAAPKKTSTTTVKKTQEVQKNKTDSIESHIEEMETQIEEDILDANSPVIASYEQAVEESHQESSNEVYNENQEEKNEEQAETPVKIDEIGESDLVSDDTPLGKEDSSQELFNNYHSDFTEKQHKVLDKLKALKEASKKLKQTNYKFVLSLVGVTIIGIIGLFTFSSDIHNLDNYKTSILGGQKEEPIQELPEPSVIKMDKGGYDIRYIIQYSPDGRQYYIFEGKKYASLEKMDLAIIDSLNNKKKVKMKMLLKNSVRDSIKASLKKSLSGSLKEALKNNTGSTEQSDNQTTEDSAIQ